MNKGKIRTRRLTIRAKILIPSIIIVVLVCGLMGYNSYARFEKSMVRMGVEEADMAATIVADSLDAKLVYKVTVGSEGTQVYQRGIHEYFKRRAPKPWFWRPCYF